MRQTGPLRQDSAGERHRLPRSKGGAVMNPQVKAEVEEFFGDGHRQNYRKDQVELLLNAHCHQSGQPHSLVWRTLYLMLEAKTGFRVSADVKSMLLAVESAGHIEDLLAVAKTL